MHCNGMQWNGIDGMHCSGVEWNGVDGMHCSGVNGMDEFGVILVILGRFAHFLSFLVVVRPQKRKINKK